MEEHMLQEMMQLAEQDQPFVLATVVHSRGSTPQKPGARLLISREGRTLGTVGGGCVEGDVWHLARQMFAQPAQARPLFQKYHLNETLAAQSGLVCGGTIFYLIQPVFQPRAWLPFLSRVLQAVQQGPAVVLVIQLVDPQAPDAVGRQWLLDARGAPCLPREEAGLKEEVLQAARKLVSREGNQFLKTSNGRAYYLETFAPPATLVLVGAGHVNREVARLAALQGMRIWVVDDRPEFANQERFPEAERIVVAEYGQGLASLPVPENSFVVVGTRGHRHDDLALEAALRTPARYIGLLGSRRKTLLIFRRLLEAGFSEEQLRRVYAPVGLDLGAITPAELAVSIMAEILMHRRAGSGMPLSRKKSPWVHLHRTAREASETEPEGPGQGSN